MTSIPLKNSETSIPRREQDREVVEEKNGEEEDEKWERRVERWITGTMGVAVAV